MRQQIIHRLKLFSNTTLCNDSIYWEMALREISVRIISQHLKYIMVDIITYIPLVVVGTLLIIAALLLTLLRNRKTTSTTPEASSKDKDQELTLEKPSPQKGQEEAGKVAISKKKKTQKADDDKQAEAAMPIRNNKQLEQAYPELYYGQLSLRPQKAMYSIEAVSFKRAHVLFATSKNQLVMYDLRKWKKDTPCHQRYFTSLDNNTASAVAIGSKYYYAALSYDKTIAYFEFKGGEGGVYFREVTRFKRNLYKSDATTIEVPQNENYIITTGSGADTVIDVWSMGGEKLAHVNTYQIEHYNIDYGKEKILVRGWTSEVKMFKINSSKDGGFGSLDKSYHLTHTQHIRCSAIDNRGYYALTICKGNIIKLWYTSSGDVNHLTEKAIDGCQLGIDEPTICAVHTLEDTNERLRTIVLVGDENTIFICDREWKIYQKLEGLSVKTVFLTGTMKSSGLALQSNEKLTIWNLTSVVEQIPEYVL